MGTQTRYNNKLGIVAAFVAAAAAVCMTGLCLPPASAQTPGFNSPQSKAKLPATVLEPEPARDRIYTVAKGQIQKDLVLTGELKAAQSIVISAPDIRRSFQTMVTYLAPEGAHIKKGDLIVEFDDSSLLSEQSESERTLDEAKLNIEKKQTDLEAQRCDLLSSISQAESQLEQDALYGKISKDLLPANTYQKYQLNLEKSKLSLEKAKEQYDNFLKSYDSQMKLVQITYSQAEIDLKQILSDIALLKVYAPQDGILIYGDNWASNRKIQEGDTLFHGMEVASLPDLSSMQVEGYVYDTEYGSIATDTHCTVRFDALPGYQTGGKITSRTNVASRMGFATEQKVFRITVRLDKSDPETMKPGMTARIDIPVILTKDTLSVPREYLGIDSDGGYYVLTGSNTREANQQSVMVGAVGDRMVEIVSGLTAGASLLPVF